MAAEVTRVYIQIGKDVGVASTLQVTAFVTALETEIVFNLGAGELALVAAEQNAVDAAVDAILSATGRVLTTGLKL